MGFQLQCPECGWVADSGSVCPKCLRTVDAIISEARGENNVMQTPKDFMCPYCHTTIVNLENHLVFCKCYPSPSLQLLVIDLGESCVVKVEKGGTQEDYTRLGGCITGDALATGHSFIRYEPFDKVKAAIDAMEGDKPDGSQPFIQKDSDVDYHVYVPSQNSYASFDIKRVQYDALCDIAGIKIPIWTGGTWKLLVAKENVHEDYPFEVWRFTKCKPST